MRGDLVRRLIAVALAAVVAGALSACGGSKSSAGAETASGDTDKSGRGELTCDGTPLSGTTGLPADFPTVGGVVYISTDLPGPTRIVTGYASTTVKAMHDGYKAAFKNNGYALLGDELEKDDSELEYRTKDKKYQGQIALRACNDETTSVRITERPTG
jgi:hypothetical protein